MKELLTIKELAGYIKLSVPTVYRLTSTRKIPHIKVGGKLVFEQEKIDSWLDSRAIMPGELA